MITYSWDFSLMRKLFVFALNLVFTEDKSSKYGRLGIFTDSPDPGIHLLGIFAHSFEAKIKAQNQFKHNDKTLII